MISGHTILELWKRSSDHPGRVYGEPRRIACDTCNARGWLPSIDTGVVPPQAGWAQKCDSCLGQGSMSLHAIAVSINEDPGVLYRLSELRVRPKTAARLLNKLIMLLNDGEVHA